jgi:hypothetical protein
MIQDLPGLTTVLNLAPAASRNTTLTGTGVDLQLYEGRAELILTSSAATAGTNPTLTVKVQDSANNSDFDDVSGLVFTVVTNAASVQSMAINKPALRRYIRVVGTLGGTDSPAFAYAVVGIAMLKSIG